MGTEQEKYVKGSEEDIRRREMGSCAEDEVRTKRKKEQRGLDNPGNKEIIAIKFNFIKYRNYCSLVSVGVLYPPPASHLANRVGRGYTAKTWKYAGK